MAAVVLARVVALSRCGHSGRGRIPWSGNARRDALELLWWIDRGRHHAGCRGRVLGRHATAAQASLPCLDRHGSEPCPDRRVRTGVRRVRGARRGGQRGGLRRSTIRTVYLQREVVELSRSACRPSGVRTSGASHVECGRRARRLARTAGESRFRYPRARRHRRRPLRLVDPQSTIGVRRAGADSRCRRRHGVRVFAVASPVGAALRPCPDVPRLRALRCRRAADGGPARRRRCGFSASRRHQARAVCLRRPRGPRRGRVRCRALDTVARCAAHHCTSVGRTATRRHAGARLYGAESENGSRFSG